MSGIDDHRLGRVADLTHRYVDEGRLPNAVVAVVHRGEEVLRDAYGWADVDEATPVAEDSIFRIYSMTKPIVCLALLQLYEQGEVLLENPVSRFIPALGDMAVWDGSPPTGEGLTGLTTVPAEREMTVHDVLRHTSGLTVGFQTGNPVAPVFLEAGLGDLRRPKIPLDEAMEVLGTLPLVHQPGARWHYGMSTDVVGRIIEVVSGQPLDEYLDEHVLGPLGMHQTGFWVRDEDDLDRLTTNYLRTPGERLFANDRPKPSRHCHRPAYLSGGGGLLSTLDDYLRFARMLLGGEELDETRVLGRKTLQFMCANHLPGGVDLNAFGQDSFAEVAMEGTGFGLGLSVVLDPQANAVNTSAGEVSWGGAANTSFWVDPVEDLVVVFLTQLVPSNTYPIRRQLRAVIHGCLT